jgi:hypothetical protein
MLIALLGGAAAGVLAHVVAAGSPALDIIIRYVAQPIGQIFLRLLFMLVVPLILSGLSLGVAGLGDLRSLGRIGLKTLAYTVLVSSIAVLIGITLVNLLEPGRGVPPETRTLLMQGAGDRAKALVTASPPKTGIDFLVQLVPANPVRAASEGDYLALMVFSLFLGVGLTLTPSAAARHLERTLEAGGLEVLDSRPGTLGAPDEALPIASRARQPGGAVAVHAHPGGGLPGGLLGGRRRLGEERRGRSRGRDGRRYLICALTSTAHAAAMTA